MLSSWFSKQNTNIPFLLKHKCTFSSRFSSSKTNAAAYAKFSTRDCFFLSYAIHYRDFFFLPDNFLTRSARERCFVFPAAVFVFLALLRLPLTSLGIKLPSSSIVMDFPLCMRSFTFSRVSSGTFSPISDNSFMIESRSFEPPFGNLSASFMISASVHSRPVFLLSLPSKSVTKSPLKWAPPRLRLYASSYHMSGGTIWFTLILSIILSY